MSKKANPAVIGAFVIATLALVAAGLVVFGRGTLLRKTQKWVLYFQESTKGLDVGSAVTFRGVKVGQVTDIKVVVDRSTAIIRTPVFVELDADRFTDSAGGEFKFGDEAQGTQLLIDRGLRAQLDLQSLVTGRLAVALDFHPGSPVQLANAKGPVPQFPTIPSTVAQLQRTIEDLPIRELLDSSLALIKSLQHAIEAPELRNAVASMAGAAEDIRTLVPELRSAIASAGGTARDVRSLVRHVDGQLAPLASSLGDTLGEASAAMRQAEKTFAAVQSAAGENSTLRYQVTNTLGELSRAMRQVRYLAEYLDRHPEALIRGKGGSGGSGQ